MAGTFADPVSKTCKTCHERCLKCNGADSSSCQECRAGYFLKDSTCSDVCVEVGEYGDSFLR